MKKIKVELISFGNELLIGEIVDTNSHWLALTLSKLGVSVTRMTTMSDDLDDITSVFLESMERNPDIVVCTGGLGPTWDDQTLLGLSKALNKDLILNEESLKIIKEKYKRLKIELTPDGEKMAHLPKGSIPLSNRLGTAPGVQYIHNNLAIFCLPGIPKEMRVIFEDHILPFVSKINPEVNFYETKFTIEGSYESLIAKITSKFTTNYPTIYIKSHPKVNIIKLHLTTFGSTIDEKLLEKVSNELSNELSEFGAISKN